MVGAAHITIVGLDEALRWADRAPANCMKATRNALKEASRETARQMRNKLPRRWRRLVKYTTRKDFGKLYAYVGMFNGHQQQGHQNKSSKIDDWFKAYWANYGTLTYRDPQHAFKKPVKHGGTTAAKRRRNNLGEPRQNFYEFAAEGFEQVFMSKMSRAFDEQVRKLL